MGEGGRKKSQVCTTVNRVSNERRRNWERWWCSLRHLGTTRGPTILTAICTTSVAPAEPHHDPTRASLKPKCRHCVAAKPAGRCDTPRVTNPWVCAGVSAKHRTQLAPQATILTHNSLPLGGPEAPVSLSLQGTLQHAPQPAHWSKAVKTRLTALWLHRQQANLESTSQQLTCTDTLRV